MADDWARPLVHWEIVARDPVAQAEFYRAMFHWDIADGPIMPVAPGLGGPEPGPGGHIRAGEQSRVVLYVQVRNITESLERVSALGGRATSDPLDVPGGPTIAFVEDPEGNPLALVQQ